MLIVYQNGIQYLSHVMRRNISFRTGAQRPILPPFFQVKTLNYTQLSWDLQCKPFSTGPWQVRPKITHRINSRGEEDRRAIPKDACLNIILQKLKDLRFKLHDHEFSLFAKETKAALLRQIPQQRLVKTTDVFSCLRQAYIQDGLAGLDGEIRFLYYGKRLNRHFSDLDLQYQASLADLRYPTEWYPGARLLQRELHLHVGPTNSGKTYAALKRLEQAKSGIYAGPLRLLAHEVYDRLNAKRIKCNLLTGDVKIIESLDVEMTSCTVEMVPVDREVEVAVVDEIQMIGDLERGWAWTQALMGLKAKEVHLCGEARVVPLIRELAAAMGDELKIHHYERLNPLITMSSSLRRDFRSLKTGDCVVAFSRVGLHGLRRDIERSTGRRVAVVYGSLPPEIRTQQAKLFNEPGNDYDFLVASDAIGMGLNLSIKRIIFESTMKFNGDVLEFIPAHEMKQIAGRAGRYRTAEQAKESDRNNPDGLEEYAESQKASAASPSRNIGLVTTLDHMDLPYLTKAMQSEAEPVMSAGIYPPQSVILRFAAYFPDGTPFSYILLRLHELSLMHPRYHLCSLKDQVRIADAIESVRNLTTSDRLIFCAAPANVKDDTLRAVLQAYARCVANSQGGDLLDIPELNLDLLNERKTMDKTHLYSLECFHKALVLYIWLSYRFAGVFRSQAMAFHVKGMVEKNINITLAAISVNVNKEHGEYIRSLRKKVIKRKSGQQEYASDTWLGKQNPDLENLSPRLIPPYRFLGNKNIATAT